jgi:hypothetical protein
MHFFAARKRFRRKITIAGFCILHCAVLKIESLKSKIESWRRVLSIDYRLQNPFTLCQLDV